MPVIASTGAMLPLGHTAPMKVSATACRIGSRIRVAKVGCSRQVSGASDAIKYAITAHPQIESAANTNSRHSHASRARRFRSWLAVIRPERRVLGISMHAFDDLSQAES